MTATVINFANLLLAALLAGAVFGAWLMMQPGGLDAATYVMQHQNGVRTLNGVMPPLGALTIFVTLLAALFARDDRTHLMLLIAAAMCFLAAGLITRFCNQPINAVIMTWSVDSPPATWTLLRDEWWRWHVIRLVFSLVGLCLTIAAALRRG
jgi:anthrone oxygenase-like protein